MGAIAAFLTIALGAITPNFESPHVHPMDLSPSGAVLAVCNTAAHRVELFHVTGLRPESIGSVAAGYDPVTVRFYSDAELWVVNHISDTINIIDLTAGVPVLTLQTADEPSDLVFAGARAFVSCSPANLVQVFDLTDLSQPPVDVEIIGEDPRALAVSPDGTKVYAALFEAGNGTTIIGGGSDGTIIISFPPSDAILDPDNPYGGLRDGQAPNAGGDFNPPLNPRNQLAPRTGLIVRQQPDGRWLDDNGADWSAYVDGDKAALSGRFPGWKLLSYDVVAIDTATLEASPVAEEATHVNAAMALAVRPEGTVTLAGTDATNEVRFEPVLNGRFLRVNLGFLNGPDGPNRVVDLNEAHLAAAQAEQHGVADAYFDGSVPLEARRESIGDPRALVWNSSGSVGYIAGMGSNNVIAVDASGNRIPGMPALQVDEGPTGLVLDESRNVLYVLNRFAGRVSVIDTRQWRRVSYAPFFDPTPDEIKDGRKHLFDTHKNSGLGMISCASCHIDGRMDRLAWDLGDPAGKTLLVGNVATGEPFNADIFVSQFETLEDFGVPIDKTLHPMKGPMTTQTFQGIIGMEPFHWRGDREGIEDFNAAFTDLQGADRRLTPEEMREFKDYLRTLHFPPNPFREVDNSLPGDMPLPGQYTSGRFGPPGEPLPPGNAQRGSDLFVGRGTTIDRQLVQASLNCSACHAFPTGSSGSQAAARGFGSPSEGEDRNGHLAIVGVDGSTQRHFKIAHLRNQHEKLGFVMSPGRVSTNGFGYLHDGSVDTIARFMSQTVFNLNSDQAVADLTAFLMSFAGSQHGGTRAPANPVSADVHAGWARNSR